MPKFVIERNIDAVGKLGGKDFEGIAQKSCGVLQNMGPKIQWIQSFVTDNKIFCVYQAENEEQVREHARQGGFPADNVYQVHRVIDPATAEGIPS